MPRKLIPLMAGVLALAEAMAPRPAPGFTAQGSTHQQDCTYNGAVQSCVVTLPEDSSAITDNTVLIHWLEDGDVTSVWFLSGGSTQVGAKVILNHNKRGRITQVVPLEDGCQRLHVKSETGNQLSFIAPPLQPRPGLDAEPGQVPPSSL